MTILILSAFGIVLLTILSWLYQHRNLSAFWIELLLPLYFGIGMAIVWEDLFLIGFFYGYGIGWVAALVMLGIRQQQKNDTSSHE